MLTQTNSPFDYRYNLQLLFYLLQNLYPIQDDQDLYPIWRRTFQVYAPQGNSICAGIRHDITANWNGIATKYLVWSRLHLISYRDCKSTISLCYLQQHMHIFIQPLLFFWKSGNSRIIDSVVRSHRIF